MNRSMIDLALDFTLAQRSICSVLDRRLSGHFGVGWEDFMLLHHLGNAPEMTLTRGELAALVSVRPSQVARMLGPLERIGLVTHQPDPDNARNAPIRLAPSGQELLPGMREIVTEAMLLFFGSWDASKRSDFDAVLTDLL